MNFTWNSAIAPLGVILLFAILRSRAGRPAKRDHATGDVVLQYSRIVVWTTGLSAVIGSVGMVILPFVLPPKNVGEALIALGIGAFFLLVGGGMCIWTARRRVCVGVRGVQAEYPFTQPRFLPWEEVTRVRYLNGEFWVYGRGRAKVLVPANFFFVGVGEAVPLILTHLPDQVQRECRVAIRRLIKVSGVDPFDLIKTADDSE